MTALLYASVLSFSLYTTIYVFSNTPNQPGAELFFSLPFTFSLCLILFRDVIPYHRDGYALKVFYFFCVIRYVLLPYVTCQIGSFASNWSSDAFTYAIIIQDIELIVCLAAIRFYYPRMYRKTKSLLKYKTNTYYEGLSLGGWIVIGIALVLISTRGFSRLAVAMRFMVISDALEKEGYYGYDIWMAHTMLAFFAIVITSNFQRVNDKKEDFLNVIFPLFACLMSCMITFGNNRMMTVYFALSALSILTFSFKKYRRTLSAVVIAVLSVVIISFTMIKQFGVDVSSGEQAELNKSDIASDMAEYVSSTEAVAKAYDRFAITGNKMEARTIIADIADKTTLFELPGLELKKLVSDVTPSYRLAMTGVEVVPVAGQTLYYGGYYLGWLLDILAFWGVIYLMVKFEIRAKLESNLGNKYLLTWMSVACSMIMCYHLGILYHAFTYVPFFTWVALTINRKIHLTQRVPVVKKEL